MTTQKPSFETLEVSVGNDSSETRSRTRVMDDHSEEDEQERKKRLKREANRRSAQLSRQRKKAFVEDLKAKNAEYLHARSVLTSA